MRNLTHPFPGTSLQEGQERRKQKPRPGLSEFLGPCLSSAPQWKKQCWDAAELDLSTGRG